MKSDPKSASITLSNTLSNVHLRLVDLKEKRSQSCRFVLFP